MGEAEKSYREASRLYAELADEQPDESAHRIDLALTSRDFGLFVKVLGRLKESAEILEVSIRLFEQLWSAEPDKASNQRTLAMMLLDRAELDYQLGKLPDTEQHANRSMELYSQLAERAASSHEPLDPLFRGMAEIRLAMALRDLGRIDDAIVVHDRATERLGAVAKINSNRDYLHQYHWGQAERGVTLGRVPNRRAEGVAELTRAIAGWEKLAKQFPQVPFYIRWQATASLYRGRLKVLLGQGEGALEDFGTGAKIFEGLVGKHPDIPVYRASLGQTYMALGQLATDSKKAVEWYGKAREMLDGALKRSPENAQDRQVLAELDRLTKSSKP